MRIFDQRKLEEALAVLGQLLKDRGEHYEIAAIGGGGLLLLGLISRPTRDLDLVGCIDKGLLIPADPLPPFFQQAIKEVALIFGLSENWINCGPSQLLTLGLPNGFQSRCNTMQYGGLTIHLASRFDQICFKLYAAVDHEPHSKHFMDLKMLKPSENELLEAEKWCKTHDISETFAAILEEVKKELNR